ncbi:hypothetical protein O4H25_14675, partial [Staphylococcus equorum]|nr:hypothetical protein [Staphylococcus equorum]
NSFYWNEDKIRVTISAQGNMRNQHSPGTIPQRKNTVIGTFERDFDTNPFASMLSLSLYEISPCSLKSSTSVFK